MVVKRSVTSSLARALICIVLLSLLSTGLALITVVGSLRDAEAVNISGSLRMQSYRLAYDLSTHSPLIGKHLAYYHQSLTAPALANLDRFYVPADVRQRYRDLLRAWHRLAMEIETGDSAQYLQEVASYVSQIDAFVFALQRYSEQKMTIVAAISVLGFIAIIGLVMLTIHFIRRRVVAPLNLLVAASQRIQQGYFSYPPLAVTLPNELGLLSQTFTRMSGDLAKLYQSLEQKVQEKTEGLTQANRTLGVLYDCSQALNVSEIDQHCFTQVLEIVCRSERLQCLQLEVQDSGSGFWRLHSGESLPNLPWDSVTLMLDEQPLGHLRWQVDEYAPHPQMMQNVATMLSRGVYFNRAQKQHLQLLLMEERATIARELHDSLAQALSFLRIQLTLLKRSLPATQPGAAQIISDFDRALADAYRQLRELLATFRLTIQEADLKEALEQLLLPLKTQTTAHIQLNCALSSQSLNAQQQVHALQIVREAVLNAIKHAQASEIIVHCTYTPEGDNAIGISDDGIGIDSLHEPEGHYGLNIMSERAARLNGTLSISKRDTGGTEVYLVFPSQV